jgi:murein DD-endopeptidase MepM/ murein hydrolase activator NlpD
MTNTRRFVPLLLIVVSSLGALSVWQPREQLFDPASVPVADVVYAAPAERVETHVLASGETLSGVLARAAITGRELSALLLALAQHENPRRLTAGAEVTVRRWIYDGAPRAVEVRLNADSTLRLARHEIGWNGELLITPTETDTVYASGSIEAGRTLYEALVYDQSSRVLPSERVSLVMSLAEVYQYKIDFTREIQPGDTYRLVYEREARPDGTARTVRIIASELTNQGKLFAAFWFDEGDEIGYYDEQGRSLRDGFLRYPVAFRITSAFSLRRYHPVLGIYRAHAGTDFGAPAGTPVKATAAGTVVFAGVNGGYGNVVDIRHAGGYMTRYAHLSRFAAGARVGAKVTQEQVIGYVGSTGLATGPHLHYELRLNGRPLDVRTAELPKGVPIDAKYMAQFRSIVETRVALLDHASETRARLARRGPAPVRGDAGGI